MNEKGLPRVLITNRVPDEHLRPLSGVAEVVHGSDPSQLMPREEVLRRAHEFHGIINQTELRVDGELLDLAGRLQIVANIGIGTDNLDLELMASRGVWATNTPEAPVDATADCTLGMLLSVSRRLAEADRYVRTGNWPRDGFEGGRWDGWILRDKVLGLIGYGRIGRAVAQRARSFGMGIIFHDPLYTEDAQYRPLESLLAEADVVSLHVPLTETTRYLIDRAALEAMKKGAVLINAARGPVVEEGALVEALQSGQLAGAGLDVFEREPEMHPALLGMEQVVLSPHIAGGTHESRFAARYSCAENVALVLRGKAPKTPVNRPLGC